MVGGAGIGMCGLKAIEELIKPKKVVYTRCFSKQSL